MADQTIKSFDIYRTGLPQKTQQLLAGKEEDITHFGLKIRRAAQFYTEGETPKLFLEEKGEIKVRHKMPTISKDLYTSLCTQQRKSLEALCTRTHIFTGETDGRMTIGLGIESVFENGICLHHTYGIPYIPGSGIKGATRAYVIEEHFEGKEAKALKDEGFRLIFGTGADDDAGQRGCIIFADAFPVSQPTVEEDTATVHYQPYYDKAEPPADWHKINPNLFLSLVDTTFQFAIGLKDQRQQMAFSLAREWIENAAEEHGFGAKTMIGYGYFKNIAKVG